jgi:hypothetical protein
MDNHIPTHIAKKKINRMVNFIRRTSSNQELLDKYQDKAITSILQFLDIPNYSSDNIMGIPDFLKYDFIYVYLPASLYKTIDWGIMQLPARLNFRPNHMGNQITIVGCDDKPLEINVGKCNEPMYDFGGTKVSFLTKTLLHTFTTV